MSTVHEFFQRRYDDIMQGQLPRDSTRERLKILHRNIMTAYQDKPAERPHGLLTRIRSQLC